MPVGIERHLHTGRRGRRVSEVAGPYELYIYVCTRSSDQSIPFDGLVLMRVSHHPTRAACALCAGRWIAGASIGAFFWKD